MLLKMTDKKKFCFRGKFPSVTTMTELQTAYASHYLSSMGIKKRIAANASNNQSGKPMLLQSNSTTTTSTITTSSTASSSKPWRGRGIPPKVLQAIKDNKGWDEVCNVDLKYSAENLTRLHDVFVSVKNKKSPPTARGKPIPGIVYAE